MRSHEPSVPLRESQVEHAGMLLGRAFYDDPLWSWVLPDDDRRFREIGWFMGVAARCAQRAGRVHTNASVSGCAVWLPPGSPDADPAGMAAAGMSDAPRRIGADAMQRFGAAIVHLGKLHHRDMPGPHWYLMILGVDPPFQGRGVGGELIQPILAEADRDGLPAYLETQKARNVPFYRKHGFEVVVETDAPGGGPHLWTMARAPRPAAQRV